MTPHPNPLTSGGRTVTPPSLDSVNYTLALVGIATAILGWWRGWWESPKRRTQREQNQEIHRAILGEPERRDRSGHITQEAQPGLVALQRGDSQRLSKVEEAIIAFSHTTGIVTEFSGRLDRVEADVRAIKKDQAKDIINAAERAATAAASAAMLNMMAERDTINGAADEPSGEL